MRSKGYSVIEFDIRRGRQYDLSSPTVLSTIMGWMKAGIVLGIWCATPCTTTSQARRARQVAGPMPAALRSSEHVRGLHGLTGNELAQVTAANKLFDNAGLILRLAVSLGIPAGEENPIASYLWSFPSRKKLFEKWSLVFVDFCAGGSPFS